MKRTMPGCCRRLDGAFVMVEVSFQLLVTPVANIVNALICLQIYLNRAVPKWSKVFVFCPFWW